jgi:3-oxoacyl-[acyl-carrier protein] reductase
MDLGIGGKVALVTGASKGLGLGVAKALAAEGAIVAISSSSAERVASAADSIGARPYVHDARDVERGIELVRAVEADLGPIDILVANSGGPPANADAFGFTLDDWRRAYDTLLLGTIGLVQAVMPGMRSRGWGRVLSLSSSVVREPGPALVLSSGHRAGLLAAMKTFARQVAADGVTVNSLLPGVIATDRIHELGLSAADRVAELPARRLGSVEEFAAAAAFLCSAPAAYISGVALLVDGAMTQSV